MIRDVLNQYYDWIKAFHIIAVVAWMAGMLYLPRLFFYHCEAAVGGADDERFQRMEKRLLRIIMNPSMLTVWVLGLTLALTRYPNGPGWLTAKVSLVVVLSGVHGMYSRWRRDFARGANRHSKRFYAVWNEVPALLLVAIVILVVVKPF